MGGAAAGYDPESTDDFTPGSRATAPAKKKSTARKPPTARGLRSEEGF